MGYRGFKTYLLSPHDPPSKPRVSWPEVNALRKTGKANTGLSGLGFGDLGGSWVIPEYFFDWLSRPYRATKV